MAKPFNSLEDALRKALGNKQVERAQRTASKQRSRQPAVQQEEPKESNSFPSSPTPRERHIRAALINTGKGRTR